MGGVPGCCGVVVGGVHAGAGCSGLRGDRKGFVCGLACGSSGAYEGAPDCPEIAPVAGGAMRVRPKNGSAGVPEDPGFLHPERTSIATSKTGGLDIGLDPLHPMEGHPSIAAQ